MSLDRLIKLAQKTGDRLIVHDEFSGQDVVILDVDSYESLYDRANGMAGDLPFDGGGDDPWNSFDDDTEDDYYNSKDDDWDSVNDVIGNRFGSSADPRAMPSYNLPIEDIPWELPSSVSDNLSATATQFQSFTPTPVPPAPTIAPPVSPWREDPLPDEPVFYEEPV